jgi:photosystem II stability/assembly factor-like uncharacterized protein
MKKFALLPLVLCLHLAAFTQNQWQWLNPQPSGSTCVAMVFTSHQTGFILNYTGDLLKTTDQGAHWSIYRNFPQAVTMSIADSTGVIAGNNGTVYISNDNGTSWQQINTGISGLGSTLSVIDIVSRDTIYLANSYGNFYKSTDRGRTWISSNVPSYSFQCLSFLNSKIGFAGGSYILETTDGGQTWQKPDTARIQPSGITGIRFQDVKNGYACEAFDSVIVTHDGGQTWRSSPTWPGQANALCIVNDTLSLVGGEDGFLYRSSDSGHSYSSVAPPNSMKDGNGLYAITFISPDTGFAAGMLGRILKTNDGGNTWKTYSPTYIPVTAAAFPTTSTGYMTTWNNVYKTSNGGQTWDSLNLTTGTDYASSSRFQQTWFLNADTGFVTSSYGAQLHRTTDGGQTWTTIIPKGSSPLGIAYDNITGISFLSPDTGYVSMEMTTACCYGLVAKTTDGGQTWNTIWSTTTQGEYFTNITWLDQATAYGLRYYQLYKSIDSGKTWTAIYTADYYQLTGIDFIDKNTAWLADENGGLSVTHDAGATWSFIGSTAYLLASPITALRFFNAQVGYVAGGNQFGPTSYGDIYKTVDSGRTWQLSAPFSGTSIQFTPDSDVVITGFGGELIKSPIAGWNIDSLGVHPTASCGSVLTASVGVAMGEIDSISIQITRPDSTILPVPVTPSSVKNGRITCVTPDSSFFTPGLYYTAKLKFYYNGAWQYSSPINFTGPGIVAPVIKDSMGFLESSSLNNIWYNNGVIVQGTNAQVWKPQFPGVYSAQATNYTCTSSMSDSVTIASSWQADTLLARLGDNCTEQFNTIVHANLGAVDSVSIQIKDSAGNTQIIPASPDIVTGAAVNCTAFFTTAISGVTYTARLRVLFHNSWQYGNTITFTGGSLPKPTIDNASNILTSSAANGNQWYRNTTVVPGAVQQQYTPTASGGYSVKVTLGTCSSPMSDSVSVTIGSSPTTGTSTGNPAHLGVIVYPNPIQDQLTITNSQNRSFILTIVNMNGTQLYSGTLKTGQATIPAGSFGPGQYILHAQDSNTGETTNVRFIKY